MFIHDWNLPGQLRSKQAMVSDADPTQSAPPPAGAGLLHCRVRVVFPSPHVLLQEDQTLHADHRPSTLTT